MKALALAATEAREFRSSFDWVNTVDCLLLTAPAPEKDHGRAPDPVGPILGKCKRYAKIHAEALTKHREKCTKERLSKPVATSPPMSALQWYDILHEVVGDVKFARIPRTRVALARYMEEWAANDSLLRQLVRGTELNSKKLQQVFPI